MKKLFAKKQLMTVALVLALGAAVYLNYYFTNEPALEAGTTPSQEEQVPSGDLGEATFVDAPVSTQPTTAPTEDKESATAGDYFDTARANRTNAREEALSILQEVLDNAGASATDKAAAEKKAEAIATNVLQESHIESLVVAKGFADCVVYIDGDHGSVVVESDGLQQQESIQIMEIMVSQGGLLPANVQIMTPKG